MNPPLVLIFSEGKTSADEIAKNICNAVGQDNPHKETNPYSAFAGYRCKLKNKYYENQIVLVPLQLELEEVAVTLLEKVEALIVYIDSGNKKALENIAAYTEFLKSKDIQQGLILYDNLTEHVDDAIALDDVRSAADFTFDAIELSRAADADDEDDISGYAEVINTLHSYPWSNINLKKDAKGKGSGAGGDPEQGAQYSVDTQMQIFEQLLIKIQAFKSISSSLQKEDVLNEAESLASQFVQLMNSDDDDL